MPLLQEACHPERGKRILAGVPTGPQRSARSSEECQLRATQAFTTVQAFITGAVADSDVTAVGAGRRILLEMGQGIIQGFDIPRWWVWAMNVAVVAGLGRFEIEQD